MPQVLVVKFTNGETAINSRFDETYGDAANQRLIAESICDSQKRPYTDIASFSVVDSALLKPATGGGALDTTADIDIVGGVVTVNTLASRKRALKAATDKRTEWLISSGFEEPIEVTKPGSGYAVGDVLTLSGGTFTTAATVQVIAVDSTGAIQSVVVVERGVYTAFPTSPQSVSGGGGSGAEIKAPNDGTQLIGTKFSLSLNAQINWTNVMLNAVLATYPIEVSDDDDEEFITLNTPADVQRMYFAGFNTVRGYVTGGASVKAAIKAAVDETAARAAYDADTRTDPWGNAPPDYDTP